MRTIVELPTTQIEALDALCLREGISRAEAVRRAVAQYVGDTGADLPGRVFGLWRDRGVDGLDYQQRLRSEWDGPAAARRPRR